MYDLNVESSKNSMEVSDEPFVAKPDPGKLCRLCANTDNQLIPIFRGEGLEHNVSFKLEKHLPIIKVTESDKLPLQICYQCASTLIAWHNLYEGCKVADKRLREILAVNEKSCQDEQAYEDFVDDFRDDYEDHSHTYSESNQLNSVIDPKNDSENTSAVEVKLACDSQVFLETENNATDSRCLRWTYDTKDVVENNSANILGTNGGAISKSQTDDLVDAFLIRPAEIICCEKKCFVDVCDCVWSNSDCPECSTYNSFKCSYCPMVFVQAKARNKHLTVSHKTELLDRCLEWLYTNSISQSGLRTVWETPKACHYECDECSAVFPDKECLIQHLRTHNRKMASLTNSKLSMKSDSEKYGPTMRKSCNFRQFQCEYCSKTFSTRRTLKKHLTKCYVQIIQDTGITLPQTNELNAETSPSIYRDSFTNVKTNYFICDACGQIFLKRHSFTRHLNLHSTKRYDCDKCRKTFASENGLHTHQTSKHKELPKNVLIINGRKYLKCDQCSFTCRNERNKLEEHMRVHTGEKPFTCELCGKQFRTKALLRVHRRFVHEGIKEHACDICGRCFSNKRYMDEHRRIHTGEKPLVCDLCGKTFRQSSSLSKHVEYHYGIKKHSCHLCDKRFSNSHHLSIHIKRHMGEASHICTQCGKGFVDRYQLKNHNVVHSEERPFVCGLCGTRFKLLKHLKQHGKTHKYA